MNCRGASGLALFTVNNRDFVAISSYYDSVNRNYQSKSVVFEWKIDQFVALPEITTNGATGVEYFMLNGDHFLLFVNSRSSPALYKWNAGTFLLHQEVPINNAKSVKEFSMNGEGASSLFLLRNKTFAISHSFKVKAVFHCSRFARTTDFNLVKISRTPRKLNVVQLPSVSARTKADRDKAFRLDTYSKS